jgi:hypothetical protein
MENNYPKYKFLCSCEISKSEYRNKFGFGRLECPLHRQKYESILCLCDKCKSVYAVKSTRGKSNANTCYSCIDAVSPAYRWTNDGPAAKRPDCMEYKKCIDKVAFLNLILDCAGCNNYEFREDWRFV